MALNYSTGLRNFLQMGGSLKHAFTGGVLEIFSGGAPASADDAGTGSKLTRITTSSVALTAETLNYGTVTITAAGNAGDTITGITVNSVQVLGVTVTVVAGETVTTLAAKVATQINSSISNPDYLATSALGVVTIKPLPLTGTSTNGFVVATTVTGAITKTDANFTSAGVAVANGLAFAESVTGALTKSGVWSGVNLLTGIAGYWRLTGSEADALGSSTVLRRLQGTCGTTGADLNMSTTSITAGATHTVDTFTLTLPAA